MSKFAVKVAHLPRLTEYQLSLVELSERLQPLKLEKSYLWDNNFWYVSLEDWGKVLKDVLFGMPKYTADRYDCENFAMLTGARVSERYLLNTCGVAIGQSPWGEHGYNLLVHKDGLIYFEPQTGNFIEVENGSYKARLVIFGG
jgi:hypothetical protein